MRFKVLVKNKPDLKIQGTTGIENQINKQDEIRPKAAEKIAEPKT